MDINFDSIQRPIRLSLWLRCSGDPPADVLPEPGRVGVVSPVFQPGSFTVQLAVLMLMLMLVAGGHDSLPDDEPQGIQWHFTSGRVKYPGYLP